MDMNSQYDYVIHASRLVGTVKLSGAKNSALRLLAASLLSSKVVTIKNFPSKIHDAQIHIEMLKKLGKRCVVQEDQVIISEPKSLDSDLNWDGRSIRNTLLILGALVARKGEGSVPLPGGCKLGERKFDLHENLLRELGADVWVEKDRLCAEAKNGLKGAKIFLPIRSTGATENAILCGCLAKGKTEVWNPHVRPEILDLVMFLRKMGAQIEVYGQEHIDIYGVEELAGVKHEVIPDNMEALTWVIGSVVTHGDVEILDFPFEHLEVPLIFLRQSGTQFYKGNNRSLIVRGGCCYPVSISTGPYPGINSDMQPLFATYSICAKGKSTIVDLRFPGRYNYVKEMQKMGGIFELKGDLLNVDGGADLHGSVVTATDLRAGAALALAGLVADGETRIKSSWQIDRGYNNFFEKMRGLGGSISMGASVSSGTPLDRQ